MGMFGIRKPRGFNHQYIYVDERKEWLKLYLPARSALVLRKN